MQFHLPSYSRVIEAGVLPYAGFCCPGNHRYYDPLRLLRRHTVRFHLIDLYGRFHRMCGRRPAEIYSVPSSNFTTFRFPYAGGFFGTAFPDSSSLLLPSSHSDGLGTLLSGCHRLNLRRCRIHFMLRTAVSRVLLELLSSLRHIQSPDASEDSYPTLWHLSGLDFHQIANDSFQNGPE